MLAADVRGLNDSLKMLRELQVKQREADERAIETAAKVELVSRQSAERTQRARRSVNIVGFALAILLPLVSLLVYVSLIEHVDSLLEQQRRDRIGSCNARNLGTLGNMAREQKLADLETDPLVKKAHADSVVALRSSLIDCENNRPANPPTNPVR